eukprot:TRINITY_DN13034_c0_g1_i1.p1 TRINITY_DN13034_c0_g1~~TRINITY_DN13034_c0_g1_i1.p1  ORF type:complete len:255 (-),score=46.49 TRINITY_DN13034_c0_g1_i1:941-1705(-)
MPVKVSRQHDQRDRPAGFDAGADALNTAASMGHYAEVKGADEIFMIDGPSSLAELDVIPENDTVQDLVSHAPSERSKSVEARTLELVEDAYTGEPGRLSEDLARTAVRLPKKSDLEAAAAALVKRAIDEPRYLEACIIVACNLHHEVPPIPPPYPGKKTETFLHALLDACQTEFEHLLDTLQVETEGGPMGPRMLATVRFAGLLHCQGLIGMRVIGQMVHDLLNCRAIHCAKELCQTVGADLDETQFAGLLRDG